MSDFGASVRGLWRLDPSVAHLNHGSYGAVPRVVAQIRSQLLAEAEANPNRWFRFTLAERFAEARRTAAAFVGAELESFAFVKNTTAGVNVALKSLRLREGDEVVVTDHAYESVVVAARRYCDQAGARLVVAAVGAEPARGLDAVMRAANDRTVAAIVDHIASPTGGVFPVAEIVAALHAAGVVTIVDAAHAPGQVEADTATLGADVWVGNFHKWAFAPTGAAGLVVDARWRHRVEPLVAAAFADEGYPASLAWVGTDDYTPYLCVPAGIDFGNRLGWPELRRRNRALAEAGRVVVAAALGVDRVVPSDAAAAMSLVPLPSGCATTLTEARSLIGRAERELASEVCFVPWRGRGYLRLSAQAYNSLDEYERLAERLPAFLRGETAGSSRADARDRPRSVVVRSATAADIPAIGALYEAWWDEEDGDGHSHAGPSIASETAPGHADRVMGRTYYLRPDLATLKARLPGLLVAVEGGDLIGVLYGRDEPVTGAAWQVFKEGGIYAEIVDLFVRRDRRSRGIGAALLDEFLRGASDRGVGAVKVESAPAAASFYGVRGFSAYRVLMRMQNGQPVADGP